MWVYCRASRSARRRAPRGAVRRMCGIYAVAARTRATDRPIFGTNSAVHWSAGMLTFVSRRNNVAVPNGAPETHSAHVATC